MTTFKPGDRVIVSRKRSAFAGEAGTVVEQFAGFVKAQDGYIPVRIHSFDYDVANDYHTIRAEELEAVDSIGTTPTYYDFPGGVQVRDISAHLTSFGGQALQYVARATRLDGNNKGEAVKDLRKALDFIQWEIERLEAGND